MKKVLGIIIMILSWILAGYIGIWLLLAGGIIQIVNSLNPVSAVGIAIGIIKILFCSIGSLIGYLGTIIGIYFMEDK